MIEGSPISTNWRAKSGGSRRMEIPIHYLSLLGDQRSTCNEISFDLPYHLRKIEKDISPVEYGKSEIVKDLPISKVKKFLSEEETISPSSPELSRKIRKELKSIFVPIFKKFQPLSESEQGGLNKLIISSIESDTSILFSIGFTNFLREYVGFTPKMEEMVRENFNRFAESISGKPMDEETRRFLINEFIYLGLKLKEGNLKWKEG